MRAPARCAAASARAGGSPLPRHLCPPSRPPAAAGTSGWIESQNKWKQALGKFEVRMKAPAPRTGVWPTFWLLGNGDCWPIGGEIDVMEAVGGYLSDAFFTT